MSRPVDISRYPSVHCKTRSIALIPVFDEMSASDNSGGLALSSGWERERQGVIRGEVNLSCGRRRAIEIAWTWYFSTFLDGGRIHPVRGIFLAIGNRVPLAESCESSAAIRSCSTRQRKAPPRARAGIPFDRGIPQSRSSSPCWSDG